ncbi:hypothetical protein ACRRVB_01985 [Candidatus Cardinium hertigii]|uniref:hypothetical protein n=1 Tax=Candidatus Cardinium hertigii TaxID=247481 RepID=UPI003D7E94CC
MSTSTSKLIFLLLLPVLTAEKCTDTKNRNLKRNAPTVAASKTATATDVIPLNDLETAEAKINSQEKEKEKEKEKENNKDQPRTEVKTAVPDVQEAKNRHPLKKDQSGEEENVFETKEDKQSIHSDNKGNFTESDDDKKIDKEKKKKEEKRKKKKKIFGIF